jgi:hypothetical protein
MDYTLQKSLIKLTSRVIDKKLNSLKDILGQDNLNELVSKIDEHFRDFQTCCNLEDTIFCLENYLNRRGIGGILTQIPDDINPLKVNEQLNEAITLRGQRETVSPPTGKYRQFIVSFEKRDLILAKESVCFFEGNFHFLWNFILIDFD